MIATKSKFMNSIVSGGQIVSICLYEYVGLSTDAKPTTGVAEGSTFFEENTSKVFMMKADGNWVEI